MSDLTRTAVESPRAWLAIDESARAELDEAASMLVRATGFQTVNITLVGAHGQHFLGSAGMPEDVVSNRGIGGAVICHHVVASGEPLRLVDARARADFAQIPYVRLGFVRAYASVPIRVKGRLVGTVCAASSMPHEIDDRALAALGVGAQLASQLLTTRAKDTVEPTPVIGPIGVKVGDMLDDKYWITARLGAGGQSEVLLARDHLTTELVAVKLVHEAAGDDALLVEGAVLARVEHPNLVRLRGWGRSPCGRHYLALEHLRGSVLADVLADPVRRPQLAGDAMRITRELASALAELHARGLLHGDVKPANVILDESTGRAVLFDLGIVQRAGTPRDCAAGTPGYSAPEQFDRTPLQPAADVYALAVVAHALLAGRALFPGSSDERLAAQRMGHVAPSETLTSPVRACLLRALALDPALRPASVIAFADELAVAVHGSAAPQVSLANAAAALELLVSIGASPWLVRHHELVVEAAELLCDRIARLGVTVPFDRRQVLLGAAVHDAGKIVHPAEMREPGSEHELAGERLLLEHGVAPAIARCCVTHATWTDPRATIEDLLVALADKLWKGKRDEALELALAKRIVAEVGGETWTTMTRIDTICEEVADLGPERLARSNV